MSIYTPAIKIGLETKVKQKKTAMEVMWEELYNGGRGHVWSAQPMETPININQDTNFQLEYHMNFT